MECKQAQAMIFDYIHDKSDKKDTRDFIKHIRSCASCREELAEYYSLITAMKQIDNDEDIQLDYSKELNDRMNSYMTAYAQEKTERIAKKIVLVFIIFCICAIYMLI